MTFELWDTSAGRIVGAFENERAALDAAYRKVLDAGRAGSMLAVRGVCAVHREGARPGPPPAALAAAATLGVRLLRRVAGR